MMKELVSVVVAGVTAMAVFGVDFRQEAKNRTVAKEYEAADGKVFRYRIAEKIPSDGSKIPLVFFLHGAGERGTNNVSQLVHGVGELVCWLDSHEKGYRVVAGQVPSGRRWVEVDWSAKSHVMPKEPSQTMALLMEFIDRQLQDPVVDASRVYVTGISMGGYGTWDVISRRPQLFAAAMPVCGGGDEAQACRIADVPIWAFHGSSDGAVPVCRTRNMMSALWACGSNAHYREYPDAGHGIWGRTYADEKVLEWFFKQRRPAGASALLRCAGLVTEKSPGWQFKASRAKGGQTFNPLEGWYPDKGGKLVSPRVAIPKTGAYYKLTFTGYAAERSYEAVAFYDANGKMISDNYDVLYPGETNKYERVVFAQEGVKEAEVFFQSPGGFTVRDVKLVPATPAEAASWCDRVYAKLPPVNAQPTGNAFLSAPKTLEALKTGKPVRILMLGDSIIQDTFHSQFHALVKRAYPKSDVTWLVSVRGSTGCWYYRVPENFESYVTAYRPDCVIIGGISNWRAPNAEYPVSGNAAMYEVGEKIRSMGMELIMVSPTLSVDTRMKKGTPTLSPVARLAYDAEAELQALGLTSGGKSFDVGGLSPARLVELKSECAKRGWGFIDAFTPAYRWLYESGIPYQLFSRDYVHSGELGKQIIARIMIANMCL